MPSADLEAVSTGTIIMRRRERQKIAKLPTTPETPRAVMLAHAGELNSMNKEMLAAVDSGDIGQIVKAMELYAKWRFVTDGWVKDMESTISRCFPNGPAAEKEGGH